MAFHFGGKIVTDGLVMYLDAGNSRSYPGTGTAWNDLTINNNNGTLVNGPTFSSANGGSIAFDGTDDYIGFSGTSNILNGLSSTSMNMWINLIRRTVGNPIRLQQVVGWRNDTDTDFFFLILDVGGYFVNTEARVRTPNGVYDINVDFTSYFEKWTNVCFVVENTRTDLYINGNNVGSNTNKTGNFSTSNELRVGQTTSGLYETIGKVANFSMYNRALSAQEVLQNYNALKGRYGL